MGKGKDENKRETPFEGLIKDVKGKHSKRMNAILATTESDEDFSVMYFKILEYATPKLQRQEISATVDVDEIIIKHVQISEEDIEKQ
jgi:hypothetical protein